MNLKPNVRIVGITIGIIIIFSLISWLLNQSKADNVRYKIYLPLGMIKFSCGFGGTKGCELGFKITQLIYNFIAWIIIYIIVSLFNKKREVYK